MLNQKIGESRVSELSNYNPVIEPDPIPKSNRFQRGRIHNEKVDVLNGMGGNEHLSNNL